MFVIFVIVFGFLVPNFYYTREFFY